MQKSLPPFLLAKFGEYRAQNEMHVRITAPSCIKSNDIYMLRGAQPVHGYVEHIPSGERKSAVFTRLKVPGVGTSILAHRVTGTLYRAYDSPLASPLLKVVIK